MVQAPHNSDRLLVAPRGSFMQISHPKNTLASEPQHLCSTAVLSGKEARSTQVGYGAQHHTCTPCAVMGWICRKARTISCSHCWIILLSETTVCFWGLKTVPESHGFLNSLSCSSLWAVPSTIPWHNWHPCAFSIPAAILEQDLGAPLALSQPHSSHQTLCNHIILCSELWSQDTRHLMHGNGSLEKTSLALKSKTPVNCPPITLAQVLYETAERLLFLNNSSHKSRRRT